MAVGITLRKMNEDDDPGMSKFFGDPAIPAEWEEELDRDIILFCQICLEDIAELDRENKLPHTGYLYVFLDITTEPWEPVTMYYDGQPDTVIDEFNALDDELAKYTQGFAMEFSETAEDAGGMKLLGVPADWGCAEPAPELILQYDPLASDMAFMEHTDGYIYYFRKEGSEDIELVQHIEQA